MIYRRSCNIAGALPEMRLHLWLARGRLACSRALLAARRYRWRDYDRDCGYDRDRGLGLHRSLFASFQESVERLGECARELNPSEDRAVRVLDPHERHARAARSD